MDIQIGADLLKALETLAEKQQRSVTEIVQEAIESYVAAQARKVKFKMDIDRIMEEHRWLLDELAKR